MPRLVYRCVVQLISVAAPAPAVCTGLWCVGPTPSTPLQPLVTTAAANISTVNVDTEQTVHIQNIEMVITVTVLTLRLVSVCGNRGGGRTGGGADAILCFSSPAPPLRYLYVRMCVRSRCPDIDVSQPDIDLLPAQHPHNILSSCSHSDIL